MSDLDSDEDCCCFVCVPEAHYAIVQNMGKHARMLTPGIHCLMFPLESVAGLMTLRVRQSDVYILTKTKYPVCGRAVLRA
jgi:hypothetical protein